MSRRPAVVIPQSGKIFQELSILQLLSGLVGSFLPERTSVDFDNEQSLLNASVYEQGRREVSKTRRRGVRGELQSRVKSYESLGCSTDKRGQTRQEFDLPGRLDLLLAFDRSCNNSRNLITILALRFQDSRKTTMLARLFSGLAIVVLVITSSSVAQEKFKLEYKLKPGEQIVSKVYHEAETETNISGTSEGSRSQTTSIKVWEVKSTEKGGNITFVYSIDSVDMQQSIGDGEELKYNSKSDKEAPKIFQRVAETVQKPLATITINRFGEVIKRDNELKSPLMGIGDLAMPLPPEPVAVGAEWQVPRDLRVRLDDGTYKVIKVRELYKLEKVSNGIATIRIESQPLTPVSDPSIEAQLIQQLSKGSIKFDLDTGRLISKKLDWSENVVGFRGAESSMRYNATWSEELLPATARTAATKPAASK